MTHFRARVTDRQTDRQTDKLADATESSLAFSIWLTFVMHLLSTFS